MKRLTIFILLLLSFSVFAQMNKIITSLDDTLQIKNVKASSINGTRITPSTTIEVTWQLNYQTESNAKIQFIPGTYVNTPYPIVQLKNKRALLTAPYWEGKYIVKIEDEDNPQIFAMSDTLTIKKNPGFTLLTDVNSFTWLNGDTHEIIYDVINVAHYKVEYSIDNGLTWNLIANNLKSDSTKTTFHQSLFWKAPNIISTKCRLKFTSIENSSVSLVTNSFEIFEEKTLGFFPLKIGNKWFYDFFYSQHGFEYKVKFRNKWEVVDTIKLSDNLTYYVIIDKFREDDNSQYQLDTFYINQNKSHFTISYDKAVNFAIKLDLYNTSDGGVHLNFIKDSYQQFTAQLKPASRWITLIDSVGISVDYTSNTYGFIKQTIVGCKINGKLYGEIPLGEEKTEQLPTSFSLFQNYPNPFNPSTTISYYIPQNKHVTLKVYDVLGREIATLVDEYKSAGTYKVTFDVKTRHGASLQSGVYFYRLTSGSYNETKKLVLLK